MKLFLLRIVCRFLKLETQHMNSDETAFVFGARLVRRRKLLKLSREQVATDLGVSYRRYARFERGEEYPDLEQCAKLMGLILVVPK